MAEQIIYNLQIEGIKNVADLERELKKVNTQLKNQDQDTKEGQDAYKAYAEQQAKLKNALDDSRKGLVENAKAQKAQEGSLNALRLKLSQLTKERNGLPLASERFKELQKELKSTSDEIKAVEEESGFFGRSVGNYAKGAQNAAIGTGTLSKGINGIGAATKANPLGLLITAVILLGDKVGKLTPLVDGLSKVFTPLFTVIERVVGIIQNGFIAAFEQFQQGNYIDGIKAFGASFEDLSDQISDATDEGRRLADIRIEIEEGEINLIKTQARLNKEIKENRLLAEDTTKSVEERIKGAERAIELEGEIEDIKQKQLNLQLEEANIKAAQNDTDRATRKEIAQLEAEVSNATAERLSKSIRLQNKLNALRKAEADAVKKIREEEEKRLASLFNEDAFKKEEELKAEQRLKALEDQEAQQEAERALLESSLDADTKLILDAEKAQTQAKIDADNKQMESEAFRVAFIKDQRNQELAATANFVGAIGALFEEQTIAQKLAASAQAVINTYLGATQALSDPNPLTPPFVKILNAGAIIASGLAAVAKINNVGGPRGGGGGSPRGGGSGVATVQASTREETNRGLSDQRIQDAFAGIDFNPRVSVTDINRVNTRQRVTVTESNL